MATPIEALGLSVEVQGVENANKALKQLVDVAGRAEKTVTSLEAAADSAGKKTRELDKGASGAADATRELDKGASGAANSAKSLDSSAGSAAKSTGALDKGASGAAKSTEALDKGAGKADKSTKGMGDSAGKATAQVDEMGKKAASTERGVSSFASAALKAGAVLAAAFSVSSISRYADAWSDMQSKVGAATKDMEGAAGMMTRLVDIANASYSPLEQTVSTYSRNVTVLRELGKSSAQAADYVESLNNMLVLTATRGERASSVQDALSKAMATGKLEADGLETVLANGGEVAAALARQLNTTTSGLRGLASQGKITGSVIAEAMISSLDDVRKRAADMPATITDAFVILTNNVTELVGRLDKATGASAAISGVIIDFAGWLRKAGDYAIALGALLAPVFEKIGSVLSVVADNSTVVGVALAGFAAPALIGGIASLATAIGVGLLGAVKAVTAAMLANPLGLIVAAAAAAGYAVYKFRDDIKQAIGVDVVATAKGAANTLIGSFAAAYEDIKFTWSNFGDIMGGAVIGGVNLAIRAINSLIQGSISGVNRLVEAINTIPGIDIGKIGSSVGISELDNPYAQRLGVSVGQRNAAVQAALSRDYVGDIGGWLDGIGKGGAGGGNGGNGGNPKGTGKGGAAVAIEAETAAIKRALADQVGALEDAMEKNEYLYSLGIRQAKEYYEAKGALGRDAGLLEAAAAEQEISVINKALAANKLTDDQRKKLLEDRRKLVSDVSAATIKAFAAELSAEEAAARKRISLQQDMTKSAQSAAGAAADQAMALATQVEQYNMTATAIARANVARADEDLAIAQTSLAMAAMRGERAEDIELISQEIEAIKTRALALRSVADSTAKLELLDKNKEFAEEAKKQNEQIGESLTDALLRGFEDGKGFAKNFKDTLVNMFKALVLRPIIQPIAQGAAGLVTGALGLASSQSGLAGSGLGFAGNLASLGSKVGDTILGGSSSFFGALGQSSLFSGTSFGAGLQVAGSTGLLGGISTAASLAGAGQYAAALGAALPGIGTALAGAMTAFSVLSSAFKGEKRSGGTFGWQDGQASFLHGPSGGTAGQEGAVNAAISATASGVNSLLRGVGSALSVTNLIAGFEGSEKGRGGVMSGVTLSDGRRIGEDGSGSNYNGTYYNRDLPTTLTTEAAAQLLTTDLKQLQIEVLQSATDIPESLKKLVDGVVAASLSDDAATALLSQISAQVAAVEGFRAMVQAAGAPLAQFKELTYDLTVAFVDASGGLESAQQNLSSFYETYHSESERMADSLASMTMVFESLGYAVPATKDEFRALVEGLSLTDEAAVKARATLLGINQTFAVWADYSSQLSASTPELVSAFAQLSLVIPALAGLSESARKSLADMAGGVNNLQSSLSSYYQAYHSEAERYADTLNTVTAEFARLGLAVPATRAEFRALIEGLDLTTEAGQKTLVALLGVRTSFEAVADHVTAIVTAARDTAETAANGALGALSRSVGRQKDALSKAWDVQQQAMQTGIDAATTALTGHQALSARVKSTLSSLFAQTDVEIQRAGAQAQLRAALGVVRAGGALPDVASLDSALGVLAQPSQQLFRTFEEYQLDFLKTANDIASLGNLTDAQISVEQRTLDVLKEQLLAAQDEYKRQIEFYDDILSTSQDQLDAALGNTQATLTVAQAMEGLRIAILSVNGSKVPGVPTSSGGSPSGLSSNEKAIWDAYNSSGIGYLDSGGWQFWNDALKNGASLDSITQQIIAINNGKNGINGSHANGLDRVPFNGYIAELHEGERVKTKAQARAEDLERAQQGRPSGLMADEASLRVLQQILARVGDISAETRATAQNTGRIARLQDRWDGDGLPPTRDELE